MLKSTPLNNLSSYYITKCLFLQYLGLFEVEGVEKAVDKGGFCGEGVGGDREGVGGAAEGEVEGAGGWVA